MASHVIIYAEGPLSMSVCAPRDMSAGEVAESVNRARPGENAPWSVSEDAAFADGVPNPGPCDAKPRDRKHWLLG
jgi:hypothetical protein